MISKYLIRAGCIILIPGIFMVPPLADFMPVDTLDRLRGLIGPDPHPGFYQVVPGGDGWIDAGALLIVIGSAMLGAGLTLKHRRK